MRIVIIFFVLLTSIEAQSLRSLINSGVDDYEGGKFSEAEVNFKKGLEKELDSFEGHFNLGSALYKQGRYDEALREYQNALSTAGDDNYRRSKVFHNMGNSLLKAQKLEESIEAYKNSLKLDPDDLETKYNLSYALNMLQNQQQNQQNQNQDKNQNDNNKQNQQDQNKQDQQNQDQKKNDQQEKQDPDQKQQPKEEITKEEAQRILEALKNNESDLQKKLRQRKGKVVQKEKDW